MRLTISDAGIRRIASVTKTAGYAPVERAVFWPDESGIYYFTDGVMLVLSKDGGSILLKDNGEVLSAEGSFEQYQVDPNTITWDDPALMEPTQEDQQWLDFGTAQIQGQNAMMSAWDSTQNNKDQSGSQQPGNSSTDQTYY